MGVGRRNNNYYLPPTWFQQLRYPRILGLKVIMVGERKDGGGKWGKRESGFWGGELG